MPIPHTDVTLPPVVAQVASAPRPTRGALTFGADFMARHCQSCHGSTSADRRGAPGESIFDTAEQVRRHRGRIFLCSAAGNDSMPPGPDDPSRAERDPLADGLACGAP